MEINERPDDDMNNRQWIRHINFEHENKATAKKKS